MLNNDLDERLVAGDDDSDPATRDDDAEKEEVPPLKSDSLFRWRSSGMRDPRGVEWRRRWSY